MKFFINYGNGAISIPSSALEKGADREELLFLMAMASSEKFRTCYEDSKDELASLIGCDRAQLDLYLSFWRGAGIIEHRSESKKSKRQKNSDNAKPVAKDNSVAEDEKKSGAKKDAAAVTSDKVSLRKELPYYSTDELASILEQRRGLASLINEAQQVLGKMLNTKEISTLVSFVEYLGFEQEYVLILLAHCAKLGKKSMRYIEKMAIGLFDEGVTDTDFLQEKLKYIENASATESKIRSMFGIKTREFSTKEKKFIFSWTQQLGYGEEIIRKAYELTVDSINEPSMAYANAILQRWAAEGYKTLEEIEEALGAQKETPLELGKSFNTDDFFEAALKSSYGNEFKLKK